MHLLIAIEGSSCLEKTSNYYVRGLNPAGLYDV